MTAETIIRIAPSIIATAFSVGTIYYCRQSRKANRETARNLDLIEQVLKERAQARAEPVLLRSMMRVDECPVGLEALHAHEITPADAAMIRMFGGAHFGPDATVTLPSGRTVTGSEMQRWVQANPIGEERP